MRRAGERRAPEWVPGRDLSVSIEGTARVAATAPKIQGINLVGIGGRFTRQIFPLPTPVASIGRESDNDLVLPGTSLSRRHARIEQDGEGWALVDSSANGTWVNGKKVEDRLALKNGDRLRFDRDEFLFVDAEAGPFDTRGYRLAEQETITIGKLLYETDDGPQELLLEESTVTIGRDSTNDLLLDMAGVSGSHCKIRWVDDEFTLVDLKSTNGTYLEGSEERIDQARLEDGMVFMVGATPIRFATEQVKRPKASQPAPVLDFPAPSAWDVLLPIVAAFVVVAGLLFVLLVATAPAPSPGGTAVLESELGR